jgi:monoamine oxidase
MKSIIIIGGGASGLMAAYELSKHKLPITILEGKNSLGGRISTLHNSSFSQPIEAGAEFIHGDLPVTLGLLKDANIPYHVINDSMFHIEKGKLKKQDHFADNWNKLMKQMDSLKQDMPLNDFLNRFFADDTYTGLRKTVHDFAGGFDLADSKTASTKALYREWSEEMANQYRIDGGYKKLIDHLETSAKANGCVFITGCCAKKISWQQNEVNVLTMCSRIFKAARIIVTVPVSVLQANEKDKNYIEFEPSIPAHIDAARNIGFGAVIKIILEFNNNFWSVKHKDAGFIFMNEAVPTWWTQLPVEQPVLTGWIGGEKAISLKDNTDRQILEIALRSLANAFEIPADALDMNLKAFKIANWNKEACINGGYSFNTTKTDDAKKILGQPAGNTIFFAGEALYQGTPGGTVEAALSNAKKTAALVLNSLHKTA